MKKTATSALLLVLFCWCATETFAQRPELPPGHPLHRLQESERADQPHPRFRSPAGTARHALVPGRDGIPRFTDTFRSTGDENWDERFGMAGVDGHVNATAVDASGNLYVGGWFTTAGNTAASSIAMWDGTAWAALGGGVSGEVVALAIDAAGNVYAGGWIYEAGGTQVNRIARWNGSTWAPLGTGIHGNVHALVVDDAGHLYAGGWFWQAGTASASNVARWDGSAWHALGSGMNEGVAALTTGTDGSIYAGGSFTTAGGTAANRVARWDGSSWHPLGAGIGGPDWAEVLALTVDDSGHVYAGGHFQTAGGAAAHHIARWNGTSWAPVGTSSYWDGYVVSLAADRNGNLYAGGWFTQLPGVGAHHIGRWNGNSWSALGTGTDGGVRTLTVGVADELFAGGWFTTAGATAVNAIAEWSAGSWHRLGDGQGLNGPVYAIVSDGHGNVYVGGAFTSAGGVAANGIARWDGQSWTSLGGGVEHPLWPGEVHAVALATDGQLYVGGWFATAGGVSATNVAKWSGSTWSSLGSGIGGEWDVVQALVVDAANILYAGGQFAHAGGVSAMNVVRWSGSSWSALGSGVNGPVQALAVSPGGTLYAGGWFSGAGGVSASSVASWNGTTWSALGTGADHGVLALATDASGNLYAGGYFTHLAGTPANRIGKWNGQQWSPLGSGVSYDQWGEVSALATTPEGGVYVGGRFIDAGGITAHHIAFWDGGGWSAPGSGVNSTVQALSIDGESVYVGGWFNRAGSRPSSYFARWERTIGLYTMAGARAAGAGATVTVQGTVTRARGRAAYFQDHSGGLKLFEASGAFRDAIAAGTVTGGTTISVTGILSEEDGMLQFADVGLAEWEILGQGAPPAAITRTLSQLAASAPGTYQSRLVRVYGGWFAPPGGTFAAGTSYQTSDASLDPQTFSLFVPEATESAIPGSPIPEYQFEFNGVIGHSAATGVHLLAIEQSDVRAILPPTLAFEPENGLEVTTDAGTVASATVTLTNTGEQAMSFAFTQFADAVRQPRPISMLERIHLEKGEADSRPGFLGRDQGGPDGFGYSWIDSNEPGGPSFNWVDIAVTGTPLVLGVDQVRYVPLPFSFSFYGEDYTTVGICSNGFLEFGGGDGWCEYLHQPMPTSWWPNNLIAPYWTDLNPAAGGAVYYRDMGDGRFIVQYQNVPRYFSHGSYTFQVILYHNGAILFQYGALSEPTEWASIGIENQDGSDGLQIAFNAPYAYDGLAVRIAAVPPFITAVEPASGTLAPGASVDVVVNFDATALYDGLYEAHLAIQTDEQDYNTYGYPIALTVIGEAGCHITPSPIAFGGVIVGTSESESAAVVNDGTASCTLVSVTTDDEDFSANLGEGVVVAPGFSTSFDVTFTPSGVGPLSAWLTVETHDAELIVALEGIGLAPPIAAVDPGSLSFELGSGGTTSGSLLLSNLAAEGAADLTFSISTAQARARERTIVEVPRTRTDATSIVSSTAPQAGSRPHYVDVKGAPFMMRRGAEAMLTHSLSQQVYWGISFGCADAYSHMRVFRLIDFGISQLTVSSVVVGVSDIYDVGMSSIRIYSLTGDFTTGNLTLIGESHRQLTPSDSWQLVNVPISASLVGDVTLVVEWHRPPHHMPGGNWEGQTAPTFIYAPGCGLGAEQPLDMAMIGYPDFHWVLNVHGTTGPGMITVDPLEGSILAGEHQELLVTINAEDIEPGPYDFEILIATNDPLTPVLVATVSAVVGVGTDGDGPPLVFALEQNYPNPFARQTTIQYALAEPSPVRIDVYDVTGRRVATVVDAQQQAGRYAVEWEPNGLASGTYFYRIQAGSFTKTFRALVVR